MKKLIIRGYIPYRMWAACSTKKIGGNSSTPNIGR